MTATAARPSQCDRVLEVLRDGRPHTIEEIHERAGTMRLNSRVSELRERGHRIAHTVERDSEGRARHTYRLLSSEDALRALGEFLVASSVESEAGVGYAAGSGSALLERVNPSVRPLSSSEPDPQSVEGAAPSGLDLAAVGSSGSEPACLVVSLDSVRVEPWEAALIEEERRDAEQANLEGELARLYGERDRLRSMLPVWEGPEDRPGSRRWTLARVDEEIARLEAMAA